MDEINKLELRENQINRIAEALGLSEEEATWTNLNDVGTRCIERAAAMNKEGAPAASGREFDLEAISEMMDRILAGQREMTPAEQKNLRGIYDKLFHKVKAAAPRPELAPALPTGNNARYDGLAGNAKWIKEIATLSQVEDILRQRADLFAELKKQREARPHLATRNRDELCSTCGGNGSLKIPGGIEVCPACNGRCWA